MVAISKASKEDLEKIMMDRIKAIPTPQMNAQQHNTLLERNREHDRQNMEHTAKILQDRQAEALETGDQKKKYAAIAVERDQRDQYNLRTRIHELENQFNIMKKTIPEDDWVFLEPLCDTVCDDNQFWDRIRGNGGFTEQDLHRVFKEEFDVNPKYIVKLIELIKLRQEIKKLEANEAIEMSNKINQRPLPEKEEKK